jgi:hypothetical protein
VTEQLGAGSLKPGEKIEVPAGSWRDSYGAIGEVAFRGRIGRVTLGAPHTFGELGGVWLGVAMHPEPDDGQPVDADRRVWLYLRPEAVPLVRRVS